MNDGMGRIRFDVSKSYGRELQNEQWTELQSAILDTPEPLSFTLLDIHKQLHKALKSTSSTPNAQHPTWSTIRGTKAKQIENETIHIPKVLLPNTLQSPKQIKERKGNKGSRPWRVWRRLAL